MASYLPSFSNLLVVLVLLPLLTSSAPTPVKKITEGTEDDLLHSVLEYLRELSKLQKGDDSGKSSYNKYNSEEKVVSSDTDLEGIGLRQGEKTETEMVTVKSINQRWNIPIPTSGGIPDYKKRGNMDLKQELLEETKALGQQVENMIKTVKMLIN
jgi:hypothetical protein